MIVLTDDGLISGWDGQRNPYFYELMTRRLVQEGVPADRIQVARGQATGTYTESLLLREHAVTHNYKRLLIVTSAYHSRRALWSLRRACEGSGIQIGIDAAPPGWQTPEASLWWTSSLGWKTVFLEYLKLIYYRINY